jgi:Flp pilus assembly protein TadG
MKASDRILRDLMNDLRWVKQRAREERGVAVPLVAIVLTVLIALSAVGVDTGRVATVATEAQTAADIAATAGTIALLEDDDPEEGAEILLNKNKINGIAADTMLTELVAGHIDSNYTFTPGGQPENAVRAKVTATVDNVVLGAIGAPHSTLVRQAIATFAGLGSGIPTLPVVIGECNFNDECYHQSCMPYLAQVPNTTNNSAWTSFFINNTNNNTVGNYIPEPCGDGDQQLIRVGDMINLNNGQSTPILRDIDCLVQNGMTTFTIPIVDCGGNFNQAKEVKGFAKIEIDQVRSQGNPKGIWLHGIYEGQQPGPPGGGQFGLLAVSLVK